MTETQTRLLSALLLVKREGQKLIPEADARALGGLGEEEKRRYIGVRVDGKYVGTLYGTHRVVHGVNIRTYQALARAGLVDCKFGIWAAIGSADEEPASEPVTPTPRPPAYCELVAQLQKISNCATRATSTDSTGAAMVQMRLALLEQTRELLARLPK